MAHNNVEELTPESGVVYQRTSPTSLQIWLSDTNVSMQHPRRLTKCNVPIVSSKVFTLRVHAACLTAVLRREHFQWLLQDATGRVGYCTSIRHSTGGIETN